MAEVYLVLSERPGGFSKLQVLKLMRSDLSEQERPEFLRMFEDEARLAARLNHPNIVQSFEVGAEDGQPYIVMEFLEGQSLHHVQQRARRLVGGFALEHELFVLCEVLEGLEYAHNLTDYEGNSLHMVHRDVSPQNVFITYSGHSKLVDFGVAKTLESSKTRAGVVKGKVAYMPPEQVRSGPIDHRADLFSVGVLLWEAIAQQPMHAELSVYEALARLVRGDLPKLRDFAPNGDERLERIVTRALQIEPDDRYQDAESFRADLFAYLDANHKVRARDVGAAVSQLFERERNEMNQVIRRAMTAPAAPGEATLASAPPITRRLPLADEAATPLPPPASAPASVPPLPAAPASAGFLRGWRLSALSLVLIAGVTAVVSFTMRSQSSRARTLIETSTAAHTSEPEPEPEPEPAPKPPATVQLAIAVEPKHASITLDGRPLAPNPYRAEQHRDDREHALIVSAPGYAAYRKTLSFEADVTLALQLEKLHVEERPARSEGRVAPASVPRTAARQNRMARRDSEPYIDLPAPKRSPRSAPELDKSDPWAAPDSH